MWNYAIGKECPSAQYCAFSVLAKDEKRQTTNATATTIPQKLRQ